MGIGCPSVLSASDGMAAAAAAVPQDPPPCHIDAAGGRLRRISPVIRFPAGVFSADTGIWAAGRDPVGIDCRGAMSPWSRNGLDFATDLHLQDDQGAETMRMRVE